MAYESAGFVEVCTDGIFQDSSATPVRIRYIEPASGDVDGGTTVIATLTGGSASGNAVTVGGSSATISAESTTSITFTTPSGSLGYSDVVITNANAQSDTLTNGFQYVDEDDNQIDRDGVAQMIADMLTADTGTLYGSTRYIQSITANPVNFNRNRVSIKTPYALALYCDVRANEYYQLQNKFETYSIDLSIMGLKSKPRTVYQNIDNTIHRIGYLIDQQLYSGDMFTAYYSDSNATVIDVTCDFGNIETELDDGIVKAECTGAITVLVNRLSS